MKTHSFDGGEGCCRGGDDDGGEIEEDGRIEGHVEGVQWEVMLFSNVFFKFTVLRKCIFTFLWFFKVSSSFLLIFRVP